MNLEIVERVIDLAIQIQQIPGPTFDEAERGTFMQACFAAENLDEVEIDEIGNVYGCLRGGGVEPPVIVSAHLDTVFPAGTDLSVHRTEDLIYGPGIGDNSIGLAGLMGLLWSIKERDFSLSSDLWLVANVGEEGLGDLRGMKHVVDRFRDRAKAYIVLEGMALGQVYHRGLGVRRYRIDVVTTGGHSWVDHGRPSAVHEIAGLINQLIEIPLNESPRTTMNVGVVSGGTSVNTIASNAHMELDLRSEDVDTLAQLVESVERAVKEFEKPPVRIDMEIVGNRPAGEIPRDHPLVELASSCLQAVGIEPRLNIGSTDANIPLALGYPAVCLGLTSGNGAHTKDEHIEISPLQLGLEQLILVLQSLAND